MAGEALRDRDSSNLCAPRGPGRRNCKCHSREKTRRVFFRAPLGFPREGTVRVLRNVLHEVLITVAALEGSSPRAPPAQRPPLLGQHQLSCRGAGDWGRFICQRGGRRMEVSGPGGRNRCRRAGIHQGECGGLWWTKHAGPKLQLRPQATGAPGLTTAPQKAHILPKL